MEQMQAPVTHAPWRREKEKKTRRQSNKKHQDPWIRSKKCWSFEIPNIRAELISNAFLSPTALWCNFPSPLHSSALLPACHLLNRATAAAVSYPKWVWRLFFFFFNQSISHVCFFLPLCFEIHQTGELANSITPPNSGRAETYSKRARSPVFRLKRFQKSLLDVLSPFPSPRCSPLGVH